MFFLINIYGFKDNKQKKKRQIMKTIKVLYKI